MIASKTCKRICRPNLATLSCIAIMFRIVSCSDTTMSGLVSAASPPHQVFLFDKGKKHATISVLEGGKVAAKDEGEDFQTVLLRPPTPRSGRSFVEFRIEKQAESQCFMAFGVCEGTHDFEGDGVDGRSALAAEGAWMLSTQSGKLYQDGGKPQQYLRGIGTHPFFPADEHLALTSLRPVEGDKVGLLLDRTEGTLSVQINGEDCGVMCRGIPVDKDIFFAADMSDTGQKVSITSRTAPAEKDTSVAGDVSDTTRMSSRAERREIDSRNALIASDVDASKPSDLQDMSMAKHPLDQSAP